MEIDAFVAAKRELETDLRQLIQARVQRFKEEVGYPVSSVTVAMDYYNYLGGQPSYAVVDVSVSVPVPGMG